MFTVTGFIGLLRFLVLIEDFISELYVLYCAYLDLFSICALNALALKVGVLALALRVGAFVPLLTTKTRNLS